MKKSLKYIVGVFLASAALAHAQEETIPKYEVGLDYSWLHVNAASGSLQRTGNGGSGYFEYNITSLFGIVGDVGGYANARKGINDKALTYMFGPRFNFRHSKLTPYAQALFGGGYAWAGPNSNSNTQNAFAMAVGGGLDYKVSKHIAIKPIQVEYVLTRFNSANLGGSTQSFGDHQNDIRYSAGVVFWFGEK